MERFVMLRYHCFLRDLANYGDGYWDLGGYKEWIWNFLRFIPTEREPDIWR
jgi:hypothetical protein